MYLDYTAVSLEFITNKAIDWLKQDDFSIEIKNHNPYRYEIFATRKDEDKITIIFRIHYLEVISLETRISLVNYYK